MQTIKYHFSHQPVIILFSLILLWSCGGNSGQNGSSGAGDTAAVAPPPVTVEPDCAVAGEVLAGNRLWFRDKNLLAVIKADASTQDAQLGSSHRVLEIYDGNTCEVVDRHELPVSGSPDYAYLLAQINYNNTSDLVGIRGYQAIYVYDLARRRLLPRLEPQYRTRRYGADAQSGQIRHLEVWEDHLIGYAEDFGSFAFDLSDPDNPEAVLPFAEYRRPDDQWSSLFLLPSVDRYQALIPRFDAGSGQYDINPLLPEPEAINTMVTTSARNNRYLILRLSEPATTAIAVDLQEARRIDLPAEVAGKKTQEILEWVKNRRTEEPKN